MLASFIIDLLYLYYTFFGVTNTLPVILFSIIIQMHKASINNFNTHHLLFTMLF